MEKERKSRMNDICFEDLDKQIEESLKKVKQKSQRKVIDMCLCEPHTYYEWEIKENKCDECKKQVH